MSTPDYLNTSAQSGINAMPPSSIGVGTPAAEWGDKVLAAVNSPTASTGGYAIATDHPTNITNTNNNNAMPTGIPTSSTSTNTSTGFNAGIGGEHASGDIPRRSGFNAGIGGEHASGDIPITTKMASLSTGGVDPSSSAFAGVTGGGLATSPNVAALSSNTSTTHSEGLTRAELNAIKVERMTGKHLEDMSGREQAAAQLGVLVGTEKGGEMTPGKELPGGWGYTDPIPAPGTSATHPTTSIYEDVTHALDKVGQAAFSVVPPSLMDKVRGTNVDTSSPTKSGGLFDQAKHILSGSEGTSTARRSSKSDLARIPGTAGSDGSVLTQAKGFMHEIVDAIKEEFVGHPAGVAGTTTAVAPAKSLPSEEFVGAQPGDHSSGVGALPGPSTETGVAILPDEKALPSGVGNLPGGPNETGVAIPPDLREEEGLATSSTGAVGIPSSVRDNEDFTGNSTSGTSGLITGVAEPSIATSAPITTQDTDLAPASTAGSSTTATRDATHGSTHHINEATGAGLILAPALGTFVGATPTTSAFNAKTEHGLPEVRSIGTAIDARPQEVVPVSDVSKSRETGIPALPIGALGVAEATPASSVGGHTSAASAIPNHITENDRANSTTSVTAIRHGEAGDLHNKNFKGAGMMLDDGEEKDLPPTPQQATSHRHQADSFDVVSKTPGHPSQGVGSGATHPAAAAIASAADETPVTPSDKTTVNSEPHPDVKDEFAAVGHGTTSQPGTAIPAKEADATESSAVAGHHGHKREASSSSNGKKSGFLAKIKAKIHHDK